MVVTKRNCNLYIIETTSRVGHRLSMKSIPRCLVHRRLSLDARKGKRGRRKRRNVPWSLALHRQSHACHSRVSRSPPLCEKRRAWGGGWTPEQSWILDSTQWIPDFRNFVGGTWIPHSSSYRDSRLLELQSRLQSPGFRITQARIPRILDSISNNFLNTGIRIPTQGGN